MDPTFARHVRATDRAMMATTLLLAAAAATAAPTAAEVGDADSFGNHVIYLGVASTPSITFKENCTIGPPPAPNRCVTLNAQPAATTFRQDKLDTIKLPEKATHSLLCLAVTPSISFTFNNQTGVAQPMARFSARPIVVVENEVLNDPSLIDPTTGLPFNGRITMPLATYTESRNMAAGEREYKQMFLSRDCIDGISRSALTQVYGLPPAVASDFFMHPIRLVFGVEGEAQLVEIAGFYLGVRVYGDRP